MLAQLDACLANERADLLMIVNRYDSFDRKSQHEIQAYQSCCDDYHATMHRHWAVRDSLINLYDTTDPLREQFRQIWLNREITMYNELMPIKNVLFHRGIIDGISDDCRTSIRVE